MGKRRRISRNRADLAHHAVGDPACRAPGHDVGDDSGIIPRLGERRPRRYNHPGFRTTQIGGTDLHAGRAQRERRRDAPPVGDAARRDHGDFHRIDHLRHQREGAGLLGDVFRQEHAAMAAGFGSLRDDGVGAVFFKPDRLLHDGRG